MGGPNTWNVRRAIAFTAVVALHAGLLIILTVALRSGVRRFTPDAFTTTFVWLPSPASPAVSRPRPPIPNESAPISPVEPPPIAPPRISVQSSADTIDWDSEARRAAGAVIVTPRVREFGRVPDAPSWLGPVRSSPKHQAGEQYRTENGDSIVWVSDRCYIVSSLPPLGMPDVIARSIPARTVCLDNSGPQGELFKDLPAYKNHHPQ